MFWLFQNIFAVILTIAFLMFLDFSLTLTGQKYYRKYYKKHVEIDKYELNPLFEKDVDEGKYPIKHMVGVILISVIIFFLFIIDSDKYMFETTVSAILIAYLIVNMNHINNIFIFKWVGKDPKLIKGKISYTRKFSYGSNFISYLSLLIIVLIIFFNVQTPITLGALIASSMFLMANLVWFLRVRS